ncbi:hypothetical protein XAC217_10062 [Xanthomonas citri pv. citri]|nr:hypothetical protein XAC1083_10062 [Xanthomonas citri pv. citri]CEF43183.1 hypothetical protein XAC217_10062 [Xanthomonas citri pv. citri]
MSRGCAGSLPADDRTARCGSRSRSRCGIGASMRNAPPTVQELWMPDHGHCRCCGGTQAQRTVWAEVYVGTGQELRRCGACAAVYLAPDLTEAALQHFYAHDYRQLFPAEIPWGASGASLRGAATAGSRTTGYSGSRPPLHRQPGCWRWARVLVPFLAPLPPRDQTCACRRASRM